MGGLLSSQKLASTFLDHLVVRAASVAIATSLVFGLLFSYRTDYLGHYLAGFAGTLAVLSFLVMIGPDDRVAIVIGFAAIGLGWVTESTVFKLAIFDPVDFLNQSLGALVAVCLVLGESRSARRGAGLLMLSIVGLIAGFYFAFQ